MMYDELKEISTDRLLQKIMNYSDCILDYIDDGELEHAKSLLKSIRFFSEYHKEVNLKTPDEYDERSFELIDLWDNPIEK